MFHIKKQLLTKKNSLSKDQKRTLSNVTYGTLYMTMKFRS